MGNRNTKSSLRNAIIYLNISADPVGVFDDKFWNQIWSEDASSAAEIIKSISTQEIRMLRDGSPKNFATLTYKMVERLCLATGTLCNTHSQQTAVRNATKILIRLIPCIFEDKAWRNFFSDNCIHSASGGAWSEPELVYPKKSDQEKDFKSYLPASIKNLIPDDSLVDEERTTSTTSSTETNDKLNKLSSTTIDGPTIDLDEEQALKENSLNFGPEVVATENFDDRNSKINTKTLMRTLILSICDLLFCPEFTVAPQVENYLSNAVDAPPEDLKSLVTCDYVWEPGVGFDSNANSTTYYDKSRSELLRLLLACLSTTLYEKPNASISNRNYWIEIFASKDNRHALPLFTSLLNTIFIYKPSKLLPFNHLLFEDTREELVELSIQILIATLDYQFADRPCARDKQDNDKRNLFIEYMSRIHRNEDFVFLIKGFTRLLNTHLEQGYLLSSSKHINFDQELLILFWRICNLNRKFIGFFLKTTDILGIVLPILYHLNENFQDTTKTALIHIGVFNLLILSGERNFGVRLNKPYLSNVLLNLPPFTGSHADLMIIIFHKLILYGQNLNQLFDFLLTIVVNISPYLKALSMLASKCLIQLFEIFSSACVIYTEPNYHQLVVFLLEIFNNLIQYQFDGNANLVYTIINKREAFLNLANLPTTSNGIQKVLNKLIKKKQRMTGAIEFEQGNEQNNCQNRHNRQLQQQGQGSARDGTGHGFPDCCSAGGQQNNDSRFETEDYCTRPGSTATVSSNHLPSKPSNHPQVAKQEVTLVATPDICHVTQPIHPFKIADNAASSDVFFASTSGFETPPLSFDDILNEGQADISQPGKTSTSGNGIGERTCLESPDEDEGSRKALMISESSELAETKSSVSSDLIIARRERWRPTPGWVKQWKLSLPLHTTLRMIEVLTPQLDRFDQTGATNQPDELEMIKFLQNGTLVGLLPVPHPILIRKYRTNSGTTLWFRVCTWGIIYVRNAIWTDTMVKLVKIV